MACIKIIGSNMRMIFHSLQFRLLNEFQHEVSSFWIRYPEWYVSRKCSHLLTTVFFGSHLHITDMFSCLLPC